MTVSDRLATARIGDGMVGERKCGTFGVVLWL